MEYIMYIGKLLFVIAHIVLTLAVSKLIINSLITKKL
jgi:hypothetical protein